MHNTTTKVKAENFAKFAALIEEQFKHGGEKYKLAGFADRESTDIISAIFGGPREDQWILGTITKYIMRFNQFQREKDLLKISTYCFILWLKFGFHLRSEENHDTDTKK